MPDFLDKSVFGFVLIYMLNSFLDAMHDYEHVVSIKIVQGLITLFSWEGTWRRNIESVLITWNLFISKPNVKMYVPIFSSI